MAILRVRDRSYVRKFEKAERTRNPGGLPIATPDDPPPQPRRVRTADANSSRTPVVRSHPIQASVML